MAAWCIEELGEHNGCQEYKVIRFQYKWLALDWIAKKPDKRRLSTQSALDIHLKVKAVKSNTSIVKDTRKVKA